LTEPSAPSPDDLTSPAPQTPSDRAGAAGLFRFTVEGRVAPGLFVAGWLATLVGAGVAAVGFMAAGLAGVALLIAGLALVSVGLFLLAGSQTVERRAAALPYAGPSPVLVLVATLAATYLILFLIDIPLDLLQVGLDRPAGDLVLAVLQAVVWLAVIHLIVAAPGAITWRDMGFSRSLPAAVEALASGAILAVPVVLATAILASLLVPFMGAAPPSPLPPTGTTGGLVLHLLAGALVVPVAEEIVFRGVATTAWLRSSGAAVAIVRSAVLFAVAHILTLAGGTDFGDAFAVATVAALGRVPIALALGWIYVRRGTVWAPIGMHATFNAILIVLGEAALRAGAGG
jgi:membrane protease YdiL (CAAX protease family)